VDLFFAKIIQLEIRKKSHLTYCFFLNENYLTILIEKQYFVLKINFDFAILAN